MPQVSITNWDNLVSNEELKKAYKFRLKEHVEKRIANAETAKYLKEGWSVKSSNSRSSIIIKPKPIGDAFEDRFNFP